MRKINFKKLEGTFYSRNKNTEKYRKDAQKESKSVSVRLTKLKME